MLVAFQASPVPLQKPEPELPLCDRANPGQIPCEEMPPKVYHPADWARLPALGLGGSDAIRATSTPSLGGMATLVQATAASNGNVELLAIWFWGHPYSGWREIERVEVEVPIRDYRRLTRRVDAALALPEPTWDGEICTDGGSYRIERHVVGRTALYEGGTCYGPPSTSMVYVMLNAFACQQVDRADLPGHFRGDCTRLSRLSREMEDESRADAAAR